MSNIAEDSDVRETALRPDRSFIIQAPAGSGKTGLLIQRYLRLLSIVDEPEEIIAITFTRKAAAEMQARILQALQLAVQDTLPKDENSHHVLTIDLAKKVLERDRQLDWQLLDSPARLRVQTIDSLCASLTRQMPVLAGLGAQPEIIEDARSLYEQAAIATLAELESDAHWSESIAALVLHLDNDLPKIKTLIMTMLMKRDQWLPHVAQEPDRRQMQRALIRMIEEELARARAAFPETSRTSLITQFNYARSNLRETEQRISLCGALTVFPSASIDTLFVWRAIADLLLVKQGGWRKRIDAKIGFPAASDKHISAEEKAERQEKKVMMQSLLTGLQEHEDLRQALRQVSQLPSSPDYGESEWKILNALCILLKLAASQLKVIFSQRNQMDFIGIAASSRSALGTDDAPTDLARQLDYQIRHLLVDEFQDVSVNQEKLIKALAREWSLDDGRSLFLVGDPMQSIYGFREADVSIFIRTFHAEQFGAVKLRALRLTRNFRSRKNLLTWVNQCFLNVFPGQDDLITGAVSYRNAEAADKTESDDNVKIYPLYGASIRQEAEQVATIIHELGSLYPDDTVGILVSSRKHLQEILPALRSANIRYRAIDFEPLRSKSAIQDLLALTRACLFPADRIAWLACLRAPWCGMTLESLYVLCHRQAQRLIRDCLKTPALTDRLSPEQGQRLEHFTDVMQEAMLERQRYTLRQTIESVWCRLGGPATVAGTTELENCASYFQLLDTLDTAGRINSLEELEQGIDKLFATADTNASEQVQIMTIHKAKGLEFDHVIMPGLGRTTRLPEQDLLAWLLREHESGQEDLILAPIKKAGEEQSPIYRFISDVNRQQQRFEDRRLLYVATTRSRNTLHLIGHARVKEQQGSIKCEPAANSLLKYLWSSVDSEYQTHCPGTLITNAENTDVQIYQQHNQRLASSWRLPELPDPLYHQPLSVVDEHEAKTPEFEWAGETIRYMGLLVHRVIRQMAENGLVVWDEARIKKSRSLFDVALAQTGVPEPERPAAVNTVSQALTNLIHDNRGQWILSDKHLHAQNELGLGGFVDGRLVQVFLDRTFIDCEGTRWIIDYKTSRHEGPGSEQFLDREQERYQPQLEGYARLMQQQGEAPIRLALYFPLLKGWREWAYQTH